MTIEPTKNRSLEALRKIDRETPSEIASDAPYSDDKRFEVVRHRIDQNNAQRASQERRTQIENSDDFGCF